MFFWVCSSKKYSFLVYKTNNYNSTIQIKNSFQLMHELHMRIMSVRKLPGTNLLLCACVRVCMCLYVRLNFHKFVKILFVIQSQRNFQLTIEPIWINSFKRILLLTFKYTFYVSHSFKQIYIHIFLSQKILYINCLQ